MPDFYPGQTGTDYLAKLNELYGRADTTDANVALAAAQAAAAAASAASATASAASASAIVLGVSTNHPVTRPSLNLDFANSKTVDPRITFTRASTATYLGSDSIMRSAASGAARIDHDPVTGACKGLLIEEARTNLLTYSEQFDNAAWVKFNATITANATTAPDGTVTADKLVEDAALAPHYLARAVASTATNITYSLIAKAGERSRIVLTAYTDFAGLSGLYATFDLTAGVVAVAPLAVGTSSNRSATIENLGNGWYRCAVSCTASAGTFISVNHQLDNGSTASYTGDGTSGLYIWGAQLEAGAFPTSYIPTTSAAVTRAADIASMTGANFSSWYRQDEGTFVCAFDLLSTSASTARAFSASASGSYTNSISVSTSATNLYAQTYSAGVPQASLVTGLLNLTATTKVSDAYRVNDFSASVLGATVTTDASGNIPTVDQFGVGSEGGAVPLNGHIASLTYYPKRLSNLELVALSTQ